MTFQTRTLNPLWAQIQEVKGAAVEQLLEQNVPEDQRKALRLPVTIQLDAQYAALEARVSKYLIGEEAVFLAPSDRSPQLGEEIAAIKERLGMSEGEESE